MKDVRNHSSMHFKEWFSDLASHQKTLGKHFKNPNPDHAQTIKAESLSLESRNQDSLKLPRGVQQADKVGPAGVDGPRDLVTMQISDSLGLEWNSRFFLMYLQVTHVLLICRLYFERQRKHI